MSNKLLKKRYNGHCLYRVIPDPRYLTLLTNGYGSLIADALSGYSGSVVHLTATPDDDYHFIDYDSTACEIVGDDLTFSNSDCTAQANFGRNVHNVTTLTSNYGSISVNKNTGYSGDIFTLSNTPNADCTFGSYSITGATLTSNQFMMEKEDVSAQGSFNRNVHNVTLQNDGHGNIGANKTTGYSGDTITLSNTPNQGYSLSGYSITGATLTSNQFKLGTGNVTAKAWFKVNLNPYNLPNYSIRVKLKDGIIPYTSNGLKETQISISPNIWQITQTSNAGGTLSYNDISRLFSFNKANLLEIQGVNASSYSSWGSAFKDCIALTSICPLDMNNVKYSDALLYNVPIDTINIYNLNQYHKSIFESSLIKTANLYNFKGTDLGFLVSHNNNLLKKLYIQSNNNLTSLENACYNLSALTSFEITNTTNVVNMNSAFMSCKSLVIPPSLNYNNVSSCKSMFGFCTNLTALPQLNFSNKINNVVCAFVGCTNVRNGITAAYKSITSVNSNAAHTRCFYKCGSNTTQGAAELAQIPSTWK